MARQSDMQKGALVGRPEHETKRLGNQWSFVIGKHPRYKEIREDSKLEDLARARLDNLEKRFEDLAMQVRYMKLLIYGGQASKELTHAARDLRPTDPPSDNLMRIRASVPELAEVNEL